MTPTQAGILGVVQGLTEFLPVSSSGHLVLAGRLLGMEPDGVAFEVWLHLATLLAVVVALRRDIRRMLFGILPGTDPAEMRAARRLWMAVIVGTIPAAVVGLAFGDLVEQAFGSVTVVGISLLVTAAFLLVTRFLPLHAEPLTPGRAVAVGTAQALAIVPGISRSGATLTAGVAVGLDGEEAARFAFLLALPAILGAAVLEADQLAALGRTSPVALAVGFVTAAVSGYLAIRVVWRLMARGRIWVFAPYCAAVGLLVLLVAR